ncbi:replication initiator protein A [Dysosmobacter sp.]
MRAAKLTQRPEFALMKQNDIQSIYYMQMPRWLFSDKRYAEMSLDAKVAYTFLLNRFQLSRRKGWTNERGEVFVIFPRKALAAELRVCEKRVTAAIRQLIEKELIWEKRCGRGDANQIYLACVKPEHDPSYQCAPFVDGDVHEGDSRTAEMEGLDEGDFVSDEGEAQNPPFKNGENGDSRTADSDATEPLDLPPSKKELSYPDLSQKEVSLFVPAPSIFGVHNGQTDDEK